MVPSFPSTLPSKYQRPPSHPSSSRTLSRSQLSPAFASTSSSSPTCRVNQARPQDYFTPSLQRARSHSSTDLRTRRQRQRLSLDSFGFILNGLHTRGQTRSYVTVPRPRSTGAYSSTTKGTCPSTIAVAQAEKMTILFNQLASALKADIKVVFDNDGSVDMLGSLNTG